MSVTGTPQDEEPESPGSPLGPTTAPAFPVLGCDVIARSRAVQVRQGFAPTIEWFMLDGAGRPVDLTVCGTFVDGNTSTGCIKLKIRETIITPFTAGDPVTSVTGRGIVASSGMVLFDLPASATARPGIFLAEAKVFSAGGLAALSNQFYIAVDRSLFATDVTGYPPTIAEIRLHLHDSGPEDNPLLESVQFDLAEIAAAIEMPILYWNESQPPIDRNYTTTSFPFRYNWLNGIVSRLYLIAAHFYRRNRLAHSAGGVQVDDLNKAQEYEAKGKELWDDYKQWVLMKKVQVNAESAIQHQGSPYSWGMW